MLDKINYTIRQFIKIRKTFSKNRKNNFSIDLNDNEKKIIGEIKKNGYYVIKNYYDKDKCSQLINEIDTIFKKDSKYIWKDKVEADFRIYGADRVSSMINEFNNDEFLLKLAIAFNESKTTSYFTLAGRIKAKDGNLGSGQGWHRDTPNPYQFKALIYLTDVELNNGPFELVEGTQEPNSMFDGIWKANMKNQQHRMSEGEIECLLQYPKFKTKTFTGEAGTVILVNTFAIHRGMPINEGERYALTNYYFQDFTINPSFIEKKFNLPPK